MLFSSLPEDMQVLLQDFAEDRDYDASLFDISGSVLAVHQMRVARYVAQVKALIGNGTLDDIRGADERDNTYVADIAAAMRTGRDKIPPIVIENGEWIDGKHRLLAAEMAGLPKLPGVYLGAWLRSLSRLPTHSC